MAILNDKQIKELDDVITPFVDHQVEKGTVSYGLSSFGYDIRVGNKFKIFTNINSNEVDPKDFKRELLEDRETDDSVLIPPNSFALASSMERFNMPDDVTGLLFDKSTYRRCGVLTSGTVLEPAWEGWLTIEISNTTPLPVRIYANEGIGQVLFFQGEEPSFTYDDKDGKYQGQSKRPEPSRIK